MIFDLRSVMRTVALFACLCGISGILVSSGAAQAPVPSFAVNPHSLNFGNLLLGRTSLIQLVTVTNTGTVPLNITLVLADNTNFTMFKSCPPTLAAGAACEFGGEFSPTQTGPLSTSVSVKANGQSQTVPFIGVGISPTVTLTPNTLNFGSVPTGTTSAPQKVTLANQGTMSLSSISIVSGSSNFPVKSSCPRTLPAGKSCSFSAMFTPGGGGVETGTVTVTDSDPSSPQLVGMSGTGTSGTASVSPTSLNFKGQLVGTTSQPQSVTLSNPGSSALSVISIVASGDYAQTNNCPASLPSGANCTVNVTFSPTSGSTRNGYVTFNDTDPTNLQTVTLTGTGSVRTTSLSIKPKVASINFTQTQQFEAYLNGTQTDNVTWYVNGVVGGNKNTGTISTTGLYTPPQQTGSFTIQAVDKSDSSQAASAPLVVTNFAGAFTYHYDNSRTGQNLNETVLTTGNVNFQQFGKLFSYPIDGYAYADPLYEPSVNIPNQGVHNVVYIATQNDSVYAFDADGLSTAPLWQASFIDPDNGVTPIPYTDVLPSNCLSSVGPVIGVMATPVIDPGLGVIYVLARTKEVSNGVATYPQRLHALNITTGEEMPGSPVLISASVPGNGEGSSGGNLAFDDIHNNARAGMLLTNGVVYLTWSSPCDQHPYHGWVIGYNENTLQQVAALNTSPNGTGASIWASGAGIAADTQGNIFFMTSNGDFNVDGGGIDYGMTILKLSANEGGLAVADYFTPYNQGYLTYNDYDLAGGGLLLLPDQTVGPPHLAVGAGKEGTIYLVNRDAMGGFSPADNNRTQQWLFQAVGKEKIDDPYFGMPAYYQNQLYFWGANDVLKAFSFYDGLLSQTPISSGTLTSGVIGYTPSISANGNNNGIVWASQFFFQAPAVLHAYDAANVSRELYNSKQAANNRDQAGTAIEFTVPTVANGKVYLATQTELDVYGLLP